MPSMSNADRTAGSPDNHRAARPSKPLEEQVSEAISAVQPTGQVNEEDAFERIYTDHRTRVFSTAFRMVGNRADAEDITQDVFVKVFKKLKAFRRESSLSTWIYRITVNACLDFLRKRKRRQAVSLEACGEIPSTSVGVKDLIEGMVSTLPEGYRKIFILHDIQGLKHSEIAEVLGISQGASKSQLHRARAQLREKLRPYIRNLR